MRNFRCLLLLAGLLPTVAGAAELSADEIVGRTRAVMDKLPEK